MVFLDVLNVPSALKWVVSGVMACWILLLALLHTATGSSTFSAGGGGRHGSAEESLGLRNALTDLQAGKLAEFMHITNTDGSLAVGKVRGWARLLLCPLHHRLPRGKEREWRVSFF